MVDRTPALYLGDRLSFSRRFLETALEVAKQHPEDRTINVELMDVATNPDGSKCLMVRKNRCPVCLADLDETPAHTCPVGADGE